MVKKFACVCAAAAALLIGGCAPSTPYTPPIGTVAIAFCTDEINNEVWQEELNYLADAFATRNYTVFTINVKDGDTTAMAAYLKQLIPYAPESMIFASPDSYSTTVAKALDELATACKTKILCYNRLQYGASSISGWVAPDYRAAGALQFDAAKGLADGSKIEILSGPTTDNTAFLLFEGAFAGIEAKLATGAWTIPSGADTYAKTALKDWSKSKAYERMRAVLETYYADGSMPAAIVAASDAYAAGALEALTLLRPGQTLPVITGFGNTEGSWMRIAYGQQTMTVDPNTKKCVDTAIEVLEAWHKKSEYMFSSSTDNNSKMVPTQIVTPVTAYYKKDFEK